MGLNDLDAQLAALERELAAASSSSSSGSEDEEEDGEEDEDEVGGWGVFWEAVGVGVWVRVNV